MHLLYVYYTHITKTRDEMRQNQRIIYALSYRNGKREREQESERVRKSEMEGEGKGKKEIRRKKNFQTVSVLNEEIYVCARELVPGS